MTDAGWHEYTGHIHFHTTYSDGSADFEEMVHAAKEAGLDFTVATDHNLLPPKTEGYYRNVLLLGGQEVHDAERAPGVNHLLAIGASHDMTSLRTHPQLLIDAVKANLGLSFIAHPIEYGSRLFPEEFPWIDWDVQSYDGIEIWNFMSECKAHANNKRVGLLLSLLPQLFVSGPWPETLELWDRLTLQRRTVAIGGSDNHGGTYHIGPFARVVFPYSFAFRTVNTHVLTPQPMTGNLALDRDLVLGALRDGHCWVGYDLLGCTAGFRFRGRNSSEMAIMGDGLALDQRTWLEATAPGHARLRLVRNGRILATTARQRLHVQITEPGVYRVEALRRSWGRQRGWIYSNPIYVLSPEDAAPS